jgi:hypothetical protein
MKLKRGTRAVNQNVKSKLTLGSAETETLEAKDERSTQISQVSTIASVSNSKETLWAARQKACCAEESKGRKGLFGRATDVISTEE